MSLRKNTKRSASRPCCPANMIKTTPCHPSRGAGGTESCDWAGMLYRMYSKWVDKKGFSMKFWTIWTVRRRVLSP